VLGGIVGIGGSDGIVDVDYPDLAAKADAGWWRTVSECGLPLASV
jgi:hypothetical protein